jgi:hypothetical protein
MKKKMKSCGFDATATEDARLPLANHVARDDYNILLLPNNNNDDSSSNLYYQSSATAYAPRLSDPSIRRIAFHLCSQLELANCHNDDDVIQRFTIRCR